MEVIYFEGCNTEYGENQPEYITLPSHKTKDGIVTSCWKMTIKERLKVLFTGKVFLSLMTFNQPLQPQLMSVEFKSAITHPSAIIDKPPDKGLKGRIK